MNSNKYKIELSSHLSLEFKETVKINNSNIDKFKVIKSNNGSVSNNLNEYYAYIESNLDENSLDKNKLNEYIENSILSNPNESNIFIDSINLFYKNDSIKNEKSTDSSGDVGDSTSKSYGKQKLEFYNSDAFKYGISLTNSEKLNEAVVTMGNASACISGMENLLNRMRGYFPKLDRSCSSIKNGIDNVGLKLANITKWHSLGTVVDLYTKSFNDINGYILDCQRADIEMAIAAGSFTLPNTILAVGGQEVYDQMQADVYKEANLLLADLTPDESGLRVINSVYEAEKKLNALRTKYFPITETDALIFVNANATKDGLVAVDGLTDEQILEKSKQAEAYRTEMFNAVSNTGMSRDFFDNCLMSDTELLAKELASAAALEVINAYKGTETEGNKTYDGVLGTKLNNMINDYYCTSEGQEAFYKGFISNKEYDINDEYNAIANTEYVKYCIANGKQNEWLKPELRGLAETINRLDNYDKFSTHRVLDPNNPSDADMLKIINDCEKNSAPLPYGIKFENGKYTITEYTNLGQNLLYYADYHYAENTWNNGENRFITAFSNQGYVDAVERGYKNAWIESRIGTTIDNIGVKQSDAYKNAERDYYILSGNITDPNRKKELQKEGELSFSDLVKCVNAADGDIKNLLNQEYVDAHKDEFAEILDSNSLWDFSVKSFNFTDNKILNIMANSAVEAHAGPSFAAVVTLGQLIGGLLKWGESSLDAANTFLHSDAFLSEYQTVDDDGNVSVDTSEVKDSYEKLFDKCWEEYRATGRQAEDFEKFLDSDWLEIVKSAKSDAESGLFYIEGYGSFSKLDNEAAEKIFIINKEKEWSVLDSSSSNQVTAAFKMGIRNGGDFSYLDNNISETIKSAADKQFETKLKVSVDNVGNFYENYVYSNDIYRFIEDKSVVKHDNILGLVANQVGNMAIPIGISMIPALAPYVPAGLATTLASSAKVFKGLSSAALFTSAFGGAAEEAFNSGASYNEALKYATYSAATELAIEHVFSGIGGYGKGWADNLIEAAYDKIIPWSEGNFAKTIRQLVTGGLGEAVEEVATDFVTPIWQSMTYMNEKSYGEIFSENVSLESLVQTAVVSFLSSMVFKGVEIKQQNSTYNKNYSKLTDAIEKISGDKLDSSVMKKISDKVFGQYIDGIIENEGVIPSELLEQLIKTTSKELLTANPEYAQELGKLQEQLKSFSSQKITIGEGKNSISITGAELLKLDDFTGLDGKYTIEDGKIKFENEEAQNKFNNKVFEMAQNQTDGNNSKLSDLVSNLRKAKDSLIIDERKGISGLIDKISNIVFENDKVAIGGIESAVAVITEFGNITNTGETVLLEHNGSIIQIPKAILSEVTTKLSIEEGKIKFNKDMNSGKFIQKLYDKAIKLCNEKISKNSYDIDKIVNKGLINKAMDAIKPSLTQSDSPITVMNSTKVSENNLTRYDIKFDFLGISKNVSVYIEGNTDATALNQVDKVKELMQTAILFSGNTSNIYLGQLIYDAKTKEMNSIKNNSNLLYVKSLELEANKTSGNMDKLQTAINSLIAINGNLKNSENVTIQKNGKNVSIPKSLLEEITSEYEIVDGKVKFTKDMSVDKFISAVYNKVINLNEQTILGMLNTNIKNSTYINENGMDLYKLEVETIIDGETRTINVYVDGNTDISSLKDSTKISQMLYELLYENKNSNNVYVGQIVYDENTGKISVKENTANKLYVDSINAMSETDEHSEVVTSEEVIETTNEEVTPSEEIKKGESYEYTIENESEGESYEYTIEEVKEDDSTAKPTETVEVKEKPVNVGSESVIANVAEAASVAATAGSTSQAFYQNNAEVKTRNDKSQIKGKNVRSNTQVKENAHVETNNNSIINISEIKSQVNSYIDSIKTECEKYIEMHQNDENFEHRFEQFKRDKIIGLNNKLSEVRKTIIESNRAEINAIQKRIDSLSVNDSIRNELLSQRDELWSKRRQEIRDIETSANQKLQKIFSELKVKEKTLPSSEELIDINNEKPVIISGSHNIVLSQIHSSEQLIDILTQTNSLEANEQRDKENLAYFIELKKHDEIYKTDIKHKIEVMYADQRISRSMNSDIIIDNTFNDGGSGITISGIDFKKLLPKDWYKYRGSADYRITMRNSSNMNPYDAISYINTLVEEANKRGLNLRAKNYWIDDAFILYLQKGDLLETVKMLEDLKDSSKYGIEVSRATQSFGNPMPFGATISDNPYYTVTMAQYEDKNSFHCNKTLGNGVLTFNGYISKIFTNTYDKMLEKYNGDTSKIEVDEFYDLMYEEHKKMMNIQSDENIPLWMNERNYREYVEGKTVVPSVVTEHVSQESKNDSDASLKNDMRTDSNVADVSSKISMRTDSKKAKASLEKMNKTSIDSSSMDNNANTESQVNNNISTSLETNDNIEVIKVDETSKLSKIVMTRSKFDMNKSYAGYEYVVKPKTDLLTAINEIKSGNFGNVLVEIPNTLELTQEVVDNIPSNVEVRITGGYTLEFLNSRGLRNQLVTGVSSLQHTTYTASELGSIVSELNKFDSLVDPSWSDSKKAQFVYEYLRDNIEYHSASEIVGGNQTRAKYYDGLMNLVQRQSTCQGFAYTYNALLERLNVKSYVVSGSLDEVGQHVFNVVELDGKLVVVDSTRELLNSNKYTGTGFNPNNVSEYKFRSYDNLYEKLIVDTLKDLQTPSVLENALKTGEYRGVSVETALSKLSKIDGVNLDSKLQELVKISETLSENEVIFNREGVYFENAEPLILTKDFVSTLTLEQKEFLAQISTEEGLIEYLQNNPLTKVELLERSELTHTDNKYVNKLIELINENEGTTKQIYNVEDVVRNNSNPIFIESTYKGDTHTLSTNEVLDFMKTGKVDTKYSYSDYVKATYSLMNDLASQKATIDINGDVFNGLNIYNEISGYLDGSSNFSALDNLNIIEKCNKFYEFISKNNISLDSDVMEKLDFISKLEENKTIANLNDYFNGKSPIVMDKYIRVYDREISTQSLIDLVEMKSPNYLILLRDYKISSIPNSERFHITRAIDKLMSSNTDLAEYYKSNYEKFNNIYQNKYVLKNSFILVPSTIGEYQTKYIDYVLDNPYAISIYDGKERQQIISTVNAFAKFLDKNNLSSYYSRSKLDFLNRKVLNIDSSVSYTTELFKMFDANSESFGANQGAVREILKNTKVSDAVQILFGETIETKDFMQTLNNMQFTEEQFKKALLTVNANNLLPLDDIQILNTLIDQVVENYPGMSKKDALQFLYLLESQEAGSRGICNYASMVNLIFDKYKNNIDLFEEHFGYPMYVTINGKEQLNTTRLLVDMYSTINDGVLVTRENDTYKVVTSSKDYRNLTRSFYGDISKENFERFLTKKGIKFNINEKFTYSTVDPNNMLHYEEIIASVRDSLANGEHIHLTSMNFSLYNLDGSMYKSNIEPHIMSVVGINEDGNLIVDSWGQKLLFDLRDELARLTNDDLSLDALKIKHYTTIVSYDISMDDALSSNETVTNIENSNIGSIQSTLTQDQREFLTQNSKVSSNISEPSIITDSNMDFVDVGELLKTTEINIEDVMPNMDNPTKTIVPSTFDIVIDGKVESSLKLEELVSNGYKLSTCYELMEESQFDEFNSAIVNYIDYIRENNISVDIDSNVEKFYESYKYAKENNVFIVNEDRILEKGADMIAIPQEIYNKYQNDLTYQVVINTIINSVESLNNFEKFIQNLYLVNEKYRICTNNIINSIDTSIRMNENFNAIYNVISKLSEHTISDNTLCLVNVYDMIYKSAEPIYLPNYINGEFRDGHQAIKTDILLDTILGKNQFPNSYNANITENCRVLYNYLQSNNITLNENIMEKLEFVNSLNEDQIILNVSEYFEGKSPIVTTEFIYLQDSQISSLDIMEILKMDSDEYIKLLRDGVCEFKNISKDNLILSIQRLLSQNQTLREQYNENYIKLKDLYNNNYVLKNTLTIVPETFNGYYTSLIDTILNNPNFINSYSISQKHNLAIVINDFIEYLKSNNVEIEYHEYEKVLEFLNRNVPNIDSSIAIKSKFGLELETNEKNGGAFGSDQGILRMLFEKVNMNAVIEKLFGNKIETEKLLEVLNQMNISDEEFTRQLLKTNRGLLFAKNTTEIRMIEDLANQVMKNYPGMSKKEAIQFLYLMETKEAGGTGICNYASLVNLIFNKYMDNPSLFEEKLGYPMYVTIDGKKQLNTATLLVDLYSIINEDVLVTKENGVYKIAVSNAEYLNLTNGSDGTIVMERFQKFLDKKGIDMNVSKTFTYNSNTELMHYEELIINIHDALARGEHVHISAWNFDICRPNGSTAGMDVGGHIMSVLEITKDGHLIVDSWGERFMIDLKSQMSKTGNYSSSSKICVVSYDISLDNVSNVSTALDTNTDINNERNTHNSADIEVFDVPNTKSNVTSSAITDEDLKFIDEGSNTRGVGAFKASAQDMQSDVRSTISINIDGVEITIETLKELQTPSNLETALKTGEYAGVRVEKALVELSKLDGVTLDSKLQELVKMSESLKQNEIIFNIEDVYSNGVMPNTINIDVYNEFIRNNPNSNISIDDLYEIINSNSVIYRLISNDTIIKNVSNESIKESFEYLLSISNRYNYENKVIREAQYLLDLTNDNYTTEELYDAFAIAHTEFNTPDVYYECSNYLKTMDVDSAVKLLKSKGYTTLDITDAFLNVAIRMDSQELSKKYYYKAFDYLAENGMAEKEAATIIRDKYRTLLYRRGTRVVTTTPNGVKIRIVNNISSNNKLFSIEKIESMIKQAEKYYSKTGLKEIVIFDSFAPHNIYSEKVQYEDYVKTHNNRRFVAAASATKSSIILWEDFDKLDSIVHEYGHTIDKHIKVVNKLSTDFSSSSIWLEAIQKDTSITSKRVSEYAYSTNGEDFAEFLKYFNRNPLDVARKYPNRYKAASKYLNLDIDSNIIERYLDSKQFFIEGIEDLSNLLTEDGTMLEFIKQYAFENLKGDNSILRTVILELDAIYESKLEIIEDYGLYSLFMDMREQERIDSNEFLKIIKDYIDGKDISSKFKDFRNLEIIELLGKEEIQEWYEEELNEMTAETEKIPVSDEDFEKMMNSLFNDSDSNSSSDTSIINDENTDIIYDSEVVDVNDEINKILKGDVYLKRFIMSKDTSLAKSISDLIKSGNVDLSSPIGVKLQQIVDTVVDNGHVINLDAFVYGTESPIVVSNEVYTEYQRISPGKSIKDLYKIVKENSLYEKLTGKERNMYIKSIDTLLGLSNDKNRLINELEVINKALKEEPSTAFDIISKYHMEAKLPQGYSEYSDLLKSGVSINEAISQLERLGYSYSEISYIVMSEAMITYNSDIVEKSYYDMFEYLKEKFIEENPKGIKKEQELIKYAEEEAAKKVRKNLTELFQIRGSKPVLVTSSGVEIRVVNNAQIDSTFIENISEQLSKIENIYGRSALETIVIYDTISPENLTNEIINYPKYREKFPNKHFMTQANATRTNINIYNSFNSLDTLSHEYGHTLDKGPLSTRVYDEKTRTFKTILFSESDAWQRAVKIDKKSVSSYGDLKLEEDFADFIKAYTKNPVATMLRYPNRYLEMSNKLGIKIDGKAISEYMSNTRLIDVLNSISNILETSTLDVIKEYVFNGQIDNNGYTFIDDILKDIRYDTLLDTIDASSVINEIQKSYNLTDEKVTFLLEQIIRGNSISDLLSESDIKLIEMLDDEGLRETYRDYLELNDVSTKDQIIEDADVDMAFPKKSIFSKKIETVSVSDIPRVFRNMNTSDIISILEGKTALKNDENFINNKKSIIRFVKYLSENNIKLSLNERANTIIENLRNGDFRLNILNFSDVLNGDTPIYGPSSINLDGIRISTDDVMVYLENKKNEISSIIASDTPNEDARDLLNAIDELGSKNDIIYDKYRKSIKLIERIERSYVYRNYDSYYLLPKSFNGIDTSNILNSDLMSLTSYINSLSNADKKAYRVALDEFGKYIYKSNTKLSRQDLSRVNKLYDVINTKKFSPDTVIKSKVYDTFEMSYQNDGEFGSNQGKVREVIEKLGITNVIESLFDEKVEKSKFLQTLSEFNISERDFITALNKRTQIGIMNNLFKDGDINLELYSSLIKQVKTNYPNMSTMEAVRFLYLIETKEAGGPGICNNPIFVNMIFDRYIGRENIFERDFGYPMYITSNNGKKVLNEARLLVDIYSTLNDGVLVHNINGNYVINTTSENYVRTYDLNGLRLDAIEKFINKKGINLNVSKSYFFNSNEELMHYDYLMEQIKSELDKGNYVILGARGFDMDVENFEFRQDCDAHGMTVVGIDTTGELILDSWGMKARVDLKKELSRLNTMFKDRNSNMTERIFTISSYNID